MDTSSGRVGYRLWLARYHMALYAHELTLNWWSYRHRSLIYAVRVHRSTLEL